MTSEKAQIQALLNGIDEVLNKTSPRLPWVMSGDAVQQRQVLEQTRQYLIQLQQQLEENQFLLGSSGLNAPAALPQAVTGQPVAGQSVTGQSIAGQSASESAQQVLQAVLQEMNYWRVNMLQPLRNEIDSLQRQREMLTQELRQLEVQRQQYSLPQQNQKLMMEFLQSAMLQMQASLSAQVSQMVAAAQPQLAQMGDASSVTSAEQMAQIQATQAQSDQMMLKLDATVQRIFESLNRNLQTYEASLEQGLHRMHDLGQQGEAMYAFLVNRVAQQMGREASSMLQPSGQPTADQPSLPPPAISPEFAVADFLSQVPTQTPPEPTPPVVPFNLSEDVLDIAALDEAALNEAGLEAADVALPTTGELETLHQALDQIDLAPLSSNEPDALADASLDLFAGDQPLAPVFSGGSEPVAPPAVMDDFDSALDLLNQLSAEMHLDGPASAEVAQNAVSPVAEPPAPAAEFVSTPDSLYGDAFDETPLDSSVSAIPVDATTLAQEWFGGLGDPAAQSPAGQPASQSANQPVSQPASQPSSQPLTQSQFSDGSVSQSLEAFLRNDAPPANPDAEFVIDPQEDAVAPPEAPETIASLFDLLPSVVSSDASGSEASSPAIELPIQEATPEAYGVDLGSSLQDLQRDFQIAESTEANPVLEGGWEVFSDLPTAVSHPASGLPAFPAAENEVPPATPVESLEGLFAEVPDLTPSTPSEVPSPAQVLSDLFAQLQSKPGEQPDSEKKN